MSADALREQDPVVIVGYAVEAPGGVDTLDGYWSLLSEGREAYGPLPRDRGWDIDRLLSLGELEGWGAVPDSGGFLTGARHFDPGFFGISPVEALAMEPQQRVALRVAWRALENAGINPASVSGDTEAGCYMGAGFYEYGDIAGAPTEHSGYQGTGKSLGVLAGRISYVLGLGGPTMGVDTACASSLTALHLAVSTLRLGECDWALAGGVCVMPSEGQYYDFAKLGGLSSDGRCRSYSQDADGTIWAEGAGVFVLERASRARALGHRVLGEVLGSGVNHGGRVRGLKTPSAQAQERLVRRTLDAARLPEGARVLVEGHGTATRVGDPLELQALAATYGEREAGAWLGSVKSNFGHAQTGSGALGLAKVLLCAERGEVAPTLNVERPSAKVDWSSTRLQLAAEREAWPAFEGRRYGAASSFGFGGTNAHMVVAVPEQGARA